MSDKVSLSVTFLSITRDPQQFIHGCALWDQICDVVNAVFRQRRKMWKILFGLRDKQPVLLFPPPGVPSAFAFPSRAYLGTKHHGYSTHHNLHAIPVSQLWGHLKCTQETKVFFLHALNGKKQTKKVFVFKTTCFVLLCLVCFISKHFFEARNIKKLVEGSLRCNIQVNPCSTRSYDSTVRFRKKTQLRFEEVS